MYEHDWYKELWYAQGSDIIPAACEVRKEQQREKRAASSVRETAARRGRPARSDHRGKREDRDSYDEDERVEGRKSLVPEGRDGTEKGRPLRKKWRSAGRSEETETNQMKMPSGLKRIAFHIAPHARTVRWPRVWLLGCYQDGRQALEH